MPPGSLWLQEESHCDDILWLASSALRPLECARQGSGRTFAFAVRLARITSDSRHCSLLTNIENFELRGNTGDIRRKRDFLPLCMCATARSRRRARSAPPRPQPISDCVLILWGNYPPIFRRDFGLSGEGVEDSLEGICAFEASFVCSSSSARRWAFAREMPRCGADATLNSYPFTPINNLQFLKR